MNPDPDTIKAIRDSARVLLARSDSRRRLREWRDRAPGFDRQIWREMAAAGWFSVLVPEAEGGLELGMEAVAALAGEAGYGLMPEPFIAAGVHPVALLLRLPRGGCRDALLASLCGGECVAGVAWQENVGAYGAEKPTLVARAVTGGFRLSGEKHFVAPLAGADGWIVSARLQEDVALFWVPAGTRGVTLCDGRRVDGSSMGELVLSEVEIPAADCLAHGEDVGMALAAAHDLARLAQGAELAGIARRALEIGLDYLKTRVQFGKPIGSFQALQHRAVDAFLQASLADAVLAEALSRVAHEPASLAGQAARVKARCAHAALIVTRSAVQFHGAMGYTDECDIGLYLKRALQLTAWLGNVPASRQRHFSLHTRTVEDLPEDAPVDPIPRDADWDAMPEMEFRRIVRAFLSARYPSHLRFMPRRLHWEESRPWYQALSAQGWVAPAWPKAHGGMGLPPDKLLAYIEEQERFGVCRAPDMGILMLGPILIRYGTPEQRARYLPKILSGEERWSQGYSEPEAGSDLASLRTEALVADDHFVVTGHKIWSTLVMDTTHMFVLVRTDKAAKPQAGISFLMIDLASPGVTVRPIRDIAGNVEFGEVFFDQVRVPRENLVGQLNQGWTIAKSLLGLERIFVGSPKQSQYALAQLDTLAVARGLFSAPAFVARYAELQLDVLDLGALYAHYAAMLKRGEELPPSVSLLKIWATESYQRIGAFLVEVADEEGGNPETLHCGDQPVSVLAPLMISTAATIYGGSSEIQRNILARSVLGLPG
ncbi:MAG: acyl-CoA dehydrogenase family protein [Proteobacteria bacterium]|nr:acyl-CoA dehydrogenase family protein [Pseudomonadota bacterium]HQR03344.1 acyl-CoA dehydrogenase family protein [Rhodocyclaceae bacterium]